MLVAWSDRDGQSADTGAGVERVFDHLGREVKSNGDAVQLSSAPTFVVLPRDLPASVLLSTPPKQPPRNEQEKAVPVVLQAVFPTDQVDVMRSAYVLPPDREHRLKIFVYNFGNSPAKGTIRLGDSSALVEVKPLDRGEVELSVARRPYSAEPVARIITGEFDDGKTSPKLSIRLVSAPPTTRPTF